MRQHTSHHSLVTDQEHEVAWLEDISGEPQKTTSDKKEFTAKIIGWILQGGVLLSATIIALGLLLLPTRPGGLSPQRLLDFPQTLSQIGEGLLILRPQAVIALGLLFLIATPVTRVAVSIIAFVFERDRKYVMITLIVLTILLFSMFFLGSITNQQHNNVQHVHFSLLVMALIFVGSIAAGLLGARSEEHTSELQSRQYLV